MLTDLMQCEIAASTFIQMIIQSKWLYILLHRHYCAIYRVIAYIATKQICFLLHQKCFSHLFNILYLTAWVLVGWYGQLLSC